MISPLSIESGSIIAERYEVLVELGAGGMGTVFKCHDRVLDDTVALKILHSHLARDENVFKRFRNEVLVARTLSHPNIVRLHDITPAEAGHYCISMEFVEGTSLKELIFGEVPVEYGLPKSPLAFIEVLPILYQILLGAAYAHGKGVIHRDLKPANVLIGRDGEVKIADFGTARMVGSDSGLTQTGQQIGTPDFMAPEQIRGEKLDEACDIYALGLIAYELLVGSKPFVADSAVALAFKHLNEPIPEFATEDSGIPMWYGDFVYKACAKDKGDRFASVGEMLVIIGQNAQELPIQTQTVVVGTEIPSVVLGSSFYNISVHDSQVANSIGTEEDSFELGSSDKNSTDTGWSWDLDTSRHLDRETNDEKPKRLWLSVLVFVFIIAAAAIVYGPARQGVLAAVEETTVEPIIRSALTSVDRIFDDVDILLSKRETEILEKPLPTKSQEIRELLQDELMSSVRTEEVQSVSSVLTRLDSPEIVKVEQKSSIQSSSVAAVIVPIASISSESSISKSSDSSEKLQIMSSSSSVLLAKVVSSSSIKKSSKSSLSSSIVASSSKSRTSVLSQVSSEAKAVTPIVVANLSDNVSSHSSSLSFLRDVEKPSPRGKGLGKGLPPARRVGRKDDILSRRLATRRGMRRRMPGRDVEEEGSLPLFQQFEMFRGNLSMPSTEGPDTMHQLTLRLRFEPRKITGDALLESFGRLSVNGEVFPRGIELILSSPTLRMRLTGSRRGNVLRGTFYSPTQGRRGQWSTELDNSGELPPT